MRHFLALDIGGTLIKYGVMTEKGVFVEKNEVDTESHLGGHEVLKKVKKIGDAVIAKHHINGICISTAGQVDSKKGKILYASSLIPDYTGIPLKDDFEDYFNLPVEVENDVNCVGLAESWLGKGKDTKSLFCLTIGTGIGGSYIIDNKLHTGHSYSGGEIGYISIEGQQFQELASTRILIENVANEKGISNKDIDGKIIFDLARKGDEICIMAINRLVYYLSKGIATIAYMMNPEMIVIGGGITNQSDYLYPLITEQLKEDLIPSILSNTKIEIAGNLNDAGMVGALRHFLLQESMQPYNRITTMIESNKHKLTKGESMIAKYITMNLGDVPAHTISEMAKKIDVSESMVTRFCKKLNFGSYNNLRLMAKEASVGTRLHDKAETSSLVNLRQDYITTLNKLETLNQPKEMAKFKEQLKRAEHIFLYSSEKMAYIINQFKFKFMKLGIPIDAFSNSYEIEMSTHLLKPEVVVIGLSLSGYNNDITRIMKLAGKKGAVSIGITSQQDSPVSKNSDVSFMLPANDDTHSEVNFISEMSLLYLLDFLLKELQEVNDTKVI